MEMLPELILTAGPSITNKEIGYVADAVMHGWNNDWSNYLTRFQDLFKQYLNVDYALATSSCTGAMHLALKALDIKEGDEVIVPELTWIATAAAVHYVGAKPVFCDIDLETWTMLPEAVEKCITPKTKAIMPVHLYGHPCDMDALCQLADKFNLYMIEDAAQAIGSLYKGKRIGSFGQAATFSFQGAKAVVTGEGGMLVTNHLDLFEKAFFWGDHGRDKDSPLFNKQIGYKYKMSNIQAALGLAQMQRIEQIIARKKLIFSWYQQRLSKYMDLISLNAEKKYVSNDYWMTSIILKNTVDETRAQFMQKMKEKAIDSRPVFHPLSSMPMFERKDNPNAYYIGTRGINLPSGHNLTEEEVDYVCDGIETILQKKTILNDKKIVLKGWLAYKQEIFSKLANLKKESLSIPFTWDKHIFELSAICEKVKLNANTINRLMQWRKDNQHGFLDSFNVTYESTQTWLANLLNYSSARILFFIREQGTDNFYGHVGLNRFDWKNKTCEIDNIVRGNLDKHKGLIFAACQTLMDWAEKELDIKAFYLQVLSSNKKALSLYQKLNFLEINRQAMYKEQYENGFYSWKPLYKPEYNLVENYFIAMKRGDRIIGDTL